MILYLLLGTLFIFIIDVLAAHFETEQRFTNLERVICILLWPISLFIFLKELWKAKNE